MVSFLCFFSRKLFNWPGIGGGTQCEKQRRHEEEPPPDDDAQPAGVCAFSFCIYSSEAARSTETETNERQQVLHLFIKAANEQRDEWRASERGRQRTAGWWWFNSRIVVVRSTLNSLNLLLFLFLLHPHYKIYSTPPHVLRMSYWVSIIVDQKFQEFQGRFCPWVG